MVNPIIIWHIHFLFLLIRFTQLDFSQSNVVRLIFSNNKPIKVWWSIWLFQNFLPFAVQVILQKVTYWCCCFGGKVKASDVGIAISVVNELICLDSLICGDPVVGAGNDVDQVEHVNEGLQHPCRILEPAGACVCN